ncbi:hypothetical protein HD806DRAFT_516636 [Xylariaceae sp. AK1471]|nr:hypothetical protein HD806DRAFT_516636 [Xylariaceae sp. AK1471]
MDPGALAAIGFAANLLQFIDWVARALEVSDQIRQNGGSAHAIGLKETAEVLRHQISRLVPNNGRLGCDTEAEQSLRRIAGDCTIIARNLLAVAEKFIIEKEKRADKNYRNKDKKFHDLYNDVRASLKKETLTLARAIQFMWKRDVLRELTEQLECHRQLLSLEILVGIRDSAIRSAAILETLSAHQALNHQESLASIQSTKDSVIASLGTRTDEISHEVARLSKASKERDLEILNAVNAFVRTLEEGQLFPVLPRVLTNYDPSLKSSSLNGHRLVEDAVLDHLQFRRMGAREAEVREAHENTCAWIFEKTQFTSWLREGQGLYWIEGKAGCGKSTLMKLIHQDSRTKKALGAWCGPCSLITESYFFWLGGTDLQKNQEGLLRSLLHGILSKRRDLISRTFPAVYDTMKTRLFVNNQRPDIFFTCDESGCGELFTQPSQLQQHQKTAHGKQPIPGRQPSASHPSDYCGTLSLTELKSALLSVTGELPTDLKLCFFIDGLDEYYGNHRDIIDLFRLLVTRSKNMKVVVSSRPEAVFVESLRHYPKLKMENLTRSNIDKYVRSKLLDHEWMASLSDGDHDGVEKLFDSIVSKACGVFLWVYLVVRSLIEGLDDGSSLSELYQITEDYPGEIEPAYDHMLDRMNPRYRAQGMQLLLLASTVQATEGGLPTLLRLWYMTQEPSSCFTASIQKHSPDKLREILESSQKRLRTRCCGLLEVANLNRAGEIKFLHRTVYEFLQKRTFMLEKNVSSTGLNQNVVLAASTLLHLKSWDYFAISPDVSFTEHYSHILKGFFLYCSKILPDTSLNPSLYVDELDKVLSQFWTFRCKEVMPGNPDHGHWADSIAGFRSQRKKAPSVDPLMVLARQYGLAGTLKRHRKTKQLQILQEPVAVDNGGGIEPVQSPWRTETSQERSFNHYATSTGGKTKSGLPTNGKKKRHHSPLPNQTDSLSSVTVTRVCSTCRVTRSLVDMGFSYSEVLMALDEARVGSDVQALTSWLIDRKQSQLAGPNISTISNTAEAITSSPLQERIKSNNSRPVNHWTTVVKAAPSSPGLCHQVPGNIECNIKPEKTKQRRQKSQAKTNLFETAGELKLRTGTMTWFLDTGATLDSDSRKGLTKGQQQRLLEFLEQILETTEGGQEGCGAARG